MGLYRGWKPLLQRLGVERRNGFERHGLYEKSRRVPATIIYPKGHKFSFQGFHLRKFPGPNPA